MSAVNQTKYENTILYLCNSLGGSIDGKKKLAKLLYYVDFDRFEYNESMKSVTGDVYKSWKMGPVPTKYMQIVDKLIKDGKIVQGSLHQFPGQEHPTEIFTAEQEADTSSFDSEDEIILSRVIKNYGGLTGKQLEELTHNEAPYIATKPDEEIAYELAFYRETDFSDVVSNT